MFCGYASPNRCPHVVVWTKVKGGTKSMSACFPGPLRANTRCLRQLSLIKYYAVYNIKLFQEFNRLKKSSSIRNISWKLKLSNKRWCFNRNLMYCVVKLVQQVAHTKTVAPVFPYKRDDTLKRGTNLIVASFDDSKPCPARECVEG